MKQIFLPLLIVSLAMIAACGDARRGDQASGGGPGPTNSKGVIGFSTLTMTNPFFMVIADSITDEAAQHGYHVIVVSGERDVQRQSNQIDDFITKGVSAIVLNPCDARSIGPAIRKANEAGIPVFTCDLACIDRGARVVSHIATDNLQGGRLAGHAMIEALGEAGGKVAILHFPQAESCQLRVQGFRDVIDAHNAAGEEGRIDVVATLDGGGVQDEGFKAAEDALQANSDLAGIFAINDPSALGAYAALAKAGRTDQVRIIAFDGQPIGKQAIKEGKIYAGPIQFPEKIGRLTVQTVVRHFAGEEVPAEQLIPTALYRMEDALNDPDLN